MKLIFKNKGFTLSEVLIALTIIGVIAAITVPALIQNTQKQEYVSALKKAYNTLSQVTNMIIAQEGLPGGKDSWSSSNDAAYDMYKKYFNNIKECAAGDTGCMAQTYKHIRGSGRWSAPAQTDRRAIILADGQQFMLGGFNSVCSGECGSFMVDVNGAKAPNTLGRDMFWFYLKSDGSIVPRGCSSSTFDPDTYCKGTNVDGFKCTCKVLMDNAINY